MAHRFNFRHPIEGVDIEDLREQLQSREFHEGLAKHLHGDALHLEHYSQHGAQVVFKRSFPLQASLPTPIQKLVKGALTMSRQDTWDTDSLTCACAFGLNAPVNLSIELKVVPTCNGFDFVHDCAIEVKIPLVGKALAGTIEKDIRQQAAGELDELQAFLKGRVAA